MTTKEQERKALAQIRKIVDGLGERSYIGMAFEGCFELAESNIEYDFGESMQDTANMYKEKVEDLQKELRETYATLEETEKCADNLRYELAKVRGELEQLQIAAAEVREHSREAYSRRIRQLEQNMLGAADIMEAYADTPNDIAYKAALENYRKAKTERDDLRKGLQLIQKLGE